MQKCSLCGGRVVNGRCEDCGLPIPPEHNYTLRGETAHYHQVNGEDVLHRVRPAGSRPSVTGYAEEESTAHVHESGTNRHAAPKPAQPQARPKPQTPPPQARIHTANRSYNRRRNPVFGLFIFIVLAMALLPALFGYLQRLHIQNLMDQYTDQSYVEEVIPSSEPTTPPVREYTDSYEPLYAMVPAEGETWDGELTTGLYVVGWQLPAGTYNVSCAEDVMDITMQIVNDEADVKTYESVADYDEDAAHREGLPLPAGTVLFLSGNGTLNFHTENGQVSDLAATAANPVTSSCIFTLPGTDDGSTETYTVGEDIDPGVYDVFITSGMGYFDFELPMDSGRTFYCSTWLYCDDTYSDVLQHIPLQEGTTVTVQNTNSSTLTIALYPSETVYIHK